MLIQVSFRKGKDQKEIISFVTFEKLTTLVCFVKIKVIKAEEFNSTHSSVI